MRGGGHNIAGLAVAEGGLMLDLSLMRGVWVDPAARTARAQAGCLLGDVDRETQLHGLAAALGFVSATGIAGLTLGGGFGYLSRRFGWTSDGVRSMEVVAADGRLVRASEKENPDLFWGLRGGGGNFGVVTGIEYALHPVGPEIYGGPVCWTAESAPEVLEAFRRTADAAPPELTLVAIMRKAPPAPWIAKEAHGQLVVMILACYSGEPREGEKLLAPLKALGKPVGDLLQRRPYVTIQSLLDATQPKGRRYYWKSEYLPGIDAALLAKQREHAARVASPHSAVIVFQLGGAIANLPVDHSAVGNRDAKAVLNIAASWEKPEDDGANVEWARSSWRDMKHFSTGGTYVNFLTEEEAGERVAAAYGGNLKRLGEVKARWDPENVFRMNKNIEPSAR
jgi:FAD/FMN-containing dehydrogenase